MSEYFDIYDINKKSIGKTGERESYVFNKGEYHIVTDVFIFNTNNEILLTQRAPEKKGGLLWEGTGGSVLAGENSNKAIRRELLEELGLYVEAEELVLFKEIRRDEKENPRFKDLWVLRKDIAISELALQEDEVCNAKWVSFIEFNNMQDKKEIVPTLDFNNDDFIKAVKLLNNEK